MTASAHMTELAAVRDQIRDHKVTLENLQKQERDIIRHLVEGEDDLKSKIRTAVLAREPALLAWVEPMKLAAIIGLPKTPAEHIILAVEELEAEENPVISRFWFIIDGEETYPLEGEDLQAWQEEGIVIHPHSGEEIPACADPVGIAFAANPRPADPGLAGADVSFG